MPFKPAWGSPSPDEPRLRNRSGISHDCVFSFGLQNVWDTWMWQQQVLTLYEDMLQDFNPCANFQWHLRSSKAFRFSLLKVLDWLKWYYNCVASIWFNMAGGSFLHFFSLDSCTKVSSFWSFYFYDKIRISGSGYSFIFKCTIWEVLCWLLHAGWDVQKYSDWYQVWRERVKLWNI